MKIPFDIKYRNKIESGEYKVETFDGYSVRIICWDALGTNFEGNTYHHLIALVKSLTSEEETIFCYYINGTLMSISGMIYPATTDISKNLYIIIPISDFTKEYIGLKYGSLDILEHLNQKQIDEINKEAEHLLNTARKQIVDEWSKGLNEFQDRAGKAYSDGYLLGFEIGKTMSNDVDDEIEC